MPKPALVSVFLLAVSVLAAAQANTNQHMFSFNMTAPVITVQLQVEYVLRDDSGQRQPASREVGSVEAEGRTRVVIGTAFAGKPAKSLQAFAFYPGCQFETVTADLTTTCTSSTSNARSSRALSCMAVCRYPNSQAKRLKCPRFTMSSGPGSSSACRAFPCRGSF